MKDWLEILFYVCAITGSLIAGVRYGYNFLREKALQETRLSPQSTIEKELRILYIKERFMQFSKTHPLLYICCFVWLWHIGYLGWRKIICHFKSTEIF